MSKSTNLNDWLLNEGSQKAIQIMEETDGVSYLTHFERLYAFVQPKPKAIDSDDEDKNRLRIVIEDARTEERKSLSLKEIADARVKAEASLGEGLGIEYLEEVTVDDINAIVADMEQHNEDEKQNTEEAEAAAEVAEGNSG